MAQIATISLPGRRVTPTVHVKWGNTDIAMGSGHPIVVQSMANTPTADVEQTVAQVLELARAGSELVRLTVNTPEAAKAVAVIRDRLDQAGCSVPLIGDFHYNGHKLLRDVPECVSTLLLNTAAITLRSIARSVTRSPPAMFSHHLPLLFVPIQP